MKNWFQSSFYSAILFYYACCILPFNYLLSYESVQLDETHCVINYNNKKCLLLWIQLSLLGITENVIKI